MNIADCRPGDYVEGWVETGTRYNGTMQDLMYARIVRVNKVTVTIVDENGHEQRIDPYHLQGHAPRYVVDELREKGKLP